MILQWNAIELLQLSARRYSLFLRTHMPKFSGFLMPLNRGVTRTEVANFWSQFLPATVENKFNKQAEFTIPYIMRHTQLLPRHIISLLNRIVAANNRVYGQFGSPIAPDIISNTIVKAEDLLVKHSLKAYRYIYPGADDALRDVLPQLESNMISFGDVHRAYNRTRKIYSNVNSVHDFIRMLTEVGVIGRRLRVTGEYAEALFEYTEPHRLILTPDDTLCIHPLFSLLYRVGDGSSKKKAFLPIYPLGADPDAVDRRQVEAEQ